jgi:hypothetical protein
VEFVGFNDPGGYSVKLESVDNGSLVPATAPVTNFVDGLYQTSWGCGIALKVPDNVIAMVYGADANCCRGPFAAFAGKTCEWFDTSAPANANWSDCPL